MADVTLQYNLTPSQQAIEQLRKIGSSNPLGRISSSFSQFDKSLDASNARVLAFGASAGLILGVQRAFALLVRETIGVEKAFQDINVILGLSNKNLVKFGQDLFDIAKNTGQSFKTVAEAAQELSRQGLSAGETLKRTRDSLILTRQSGLDAEDAVKAITAALNSFQREALSSTQVINKLANVDANFAVSSKDLANAITRTGSAAEAAGVNFDQLIGLVTAAQQTTQRGGAVIAQALNSVFARIARPEVIEQLKELGVQIDNSQNGIDKLKALAAALQSAGQEQGAMIRETAGGVRNLNVLSAVLSDLQNQYSLVSRATNESTNATNQAIIRNEELNKTYQTLTNRTLVNLQQVGAQFGKLTIGPGLEKILGNINSILEGAISKNSDNAGEILGKGLLKGLGEFLGGPGLILAGAAIVKLISRLTIESAAAFKTVLGINRVQNDISGILQTQPALINQAVASEKGLLEVSRIVNSVLKERAIIQANLAKATPLVANRISNQPKAAVGLIPAAQEMAGAYAGGYTPGEIRETNIPNYGKVIYNSAERIRHFPGLSQPAIIPPQNSKAGIIYNQSFIQQHGFSPYKAGGYVPNYAKFLDPKQRLFDFYKQSIVDDINPEGLKAILNSGGNDDFGSFVIPARRFQKPEQGGYPSVRGGTFYLPKDSKQFYGYSSNRFNYGGDQEILADLVFENPFLVRAGTGGAGPEKAYKSLFGPKALKSLQNDVIKGVGGYVNYAYGYSKGAPLDRIEEFISRYAPNRRSELSANYITNNSKYGNQLRYALQELAIGQSFKDIGFDSILSYGYQRKTRSPVLREIFALNQGVYPIANKGLVPNYANFPETFYKNYGVALPDLGYYQRFLPGEYKKFVNFSRSPDIQKLIEQENILMGDNGLPQPFFKSLRSWNAINYKKKKTLDLPWPHTYFFPSASQAINYNGPQSAIISGLVKGKISEFAPGKQLRYEDSSFLLPDESEELFKKYPFKGLFGIHQGNDDVAELALHRADENFLQYSAFKFGKYPKGGFRGFRSLGLVPNFSPISDAIVREANAGISISNIRIGSSPLIKSNFNPAGLGVYNTQDEPAGLHQGITRAIKEGRNPKTYGVPNFAPNYQGYITSAFSDPFNRPTPYAPIQGEKLQALEQEITKYQDQMRKGLRSFNDLDSTLKSLRDTFLLTEQTVNKIRTSKFLPILRTQRVSPGGVSRTQLSSTVSSEELNQTLFGAFTGGAQGEFIPSPQHATILPNPAKYKNLPTEERQRLLATLLTANARNRNIQTGYRDILGDIQTTERQRISVTNPSNFDQFQRKFIGNYHIPNNPVLNQLLDFKKAQELQNGPFGYSAIQNYKLFGNQFPKSQPISVSQRLGNFINNPKFQNAAFTSSFILPVAAGALSEAIGNTSPQRRGVGQLAQSSANIASYTALGATLGFGVPGAIGGAAIGGLLEAPRVIKSFTDTIPDLEKELDKLKDIITETNTSFSNLIVSNEKIKKYSRGELRLTPNEYGDIKTEQQNQIVALSNLFPKYSNQISNAANTGNLNDIEQLNRQLSREQFSQVLKLQASLLKNKISSDSPLNRFFFQNFNDQKTIKDFNSIIFNSTNATTGQSFGNLLIESYQKNPKKNRLTDLQQFIESINAPVPSLSEISKSSEVLRESGKTGEDVNQIAERKRNEIIQSRIDEAKLGATTRFRSFNKLGFPLFEQESKLVQETNSLKDIQNIFKNLPLDFSSLINAAKAPKPNEQLETRDITDVVKAFFDLRKNIELFSNRLEIIASSDLAKIQRELNLKVSGIQTSTAISSGKLQAFSPFGAAELEIGGAATEQRANIEAQINILKRNQVLNNQSLPTNIFAGFSELALKESQQNKNTSPGTFLQGYKEKLGGVLEQIIPGYKSQETIFTGTSFESKQNDPFAAINDYLTNAQPEKVNEFVKKLTEYREGLFKLSFNETGKTRDELEKTIELIDTATIKYQTSTDTNEQKLQELQQNLKDVTELSNNNLKKAKQALLNNIIQQNANIIDNIEQYNQSLLNIYENNKGTGFQNVRNVAFGVSTLNLNTARERFKNGDISSRQFAPYVSENARQEIETTGIISRGTLKDVFKSGFGYNQRDFSQDLLQDMENLRDVFSSIRGTAKDAFASIVDGSKSAGDAARQFGITIATNVLNNVAKLAFDNLLGNIFSSSNLQSIGSLFTKKAVGGLVGYADGGIVYGGSGIRDDVPAMLNSGAFVIKKSSVNKYGKSMLDSLNYGQGFANGGINQILKNTFKVTGKGEKIKGVFDVDPRLSVIGQTDENNPSNILKFDREQNYIGYLKTIENYKIAMKNFESAQTQRLYGAYLSGIINIGGSYLGQYKSNKLNKQAIQNGYDFNGFQNNYSNVAARGGLLTPQGFRKFAYGGSVDTVPALLTGGEYVMSREAVNRMGVSFMNNLNNGQVQPRRYAVGGLVGKDSSNTSLPSDNNYNQQIINTLLRIAKINEEIRDVGSNKKVETDKNAPNKETNYNTPQISIVINMNNDKTSTQTQSKNDQSSDSKNIKDFAELMKNVALNTILEQQRNGGLLSKK